MPRMLTPSHSGSLRRSGTSLNGSLHGSRTSLSSFGSTTSVARRAVMMNRYNGSGLSLRRSSLQNAGSTQSSTSSLRREASRQRQHQLNMMDQEPSSKNAVWDFVNQASVSKGPSSFSTVSTDRSSQSSLLRSPTPSPPPSSPIDNNDALQRYYALHKKYMQHRPKKNNAPVVPTLQRPILHATNNIPRRNSLSFMPPAQIKEEDTWGQFVETKLDDDAEDELKTLSVVTRKYPASFAHLNRSQFQ